MSKPTLSYGLNLKKSSSSTKPPPPKRKPIFGDDDDDDDAPQRSAAVDTIRELDDFPPQSADADPRRKSKLKNAPPSQPPKLKSKVSESVMFGDISSSLTSRKNAEKAQELDPTIFDYDGVYDSLRPEKKKTQEDAERKPKYMGSLMAAAAVRKRDALIAEEKKIAREREAEGEEFADKEKFVTEAYRRQQEENRRIEEEERRREEDEAKKNKSGGMTAFYKKMLNQGDERHAEIMKAAEERAKAGGSRDEEAEGDMEKTEADVAREINAKGGSVAINEDGQVVDKRQLLKGGLNLGAKKTEPPKLADRNTTHRDNRGPGRGLVGSGGGKHAMRERQSRMLEDQLAEALKRSREEEEEEQQKVEAASKSRKTESDVSAAKARYLARKREAEEAKKKGLAEQP